MAAVNPRTFPIALVLAGAIIISTSVYAYAFGQHTDFLLTIVSAGMITGFCAILSSIPVYLWERKKYYEDRKEIHL